VINTGDVLICTSGNQFYKKGELYTVGNFVNDKYFILSTGHDDEHWYATIDEQGIYVSFDCLTEECDDAWFVATEDKNDDWLNAYNTLDHA